MTLFLSIKVRIESYNISPEGRGLIKSLLLIDQADVEIIKLNFMGMFVDISIKQVIYVALIIDSLADFALLIL